MQGQEPSVEDIWDKPVLRQVLFAGAIWYLIGAVSWSMPAGFPLKDRIDRFYNREFRRLGLWQGWDMFAPNPRDEDIYVSAKIDFADGTSVTEDLSNMAEMPYGERYAKERWRKFMNDNMRLDSNKAMWNDSAVWIARRASRREGKEATKVELYRHWRKCLTPGEKGDVLKDDRPFNKFLFHSFAMATKPVEPVAKPLVPLNAPGKPR
ncbi:MAG: hypothetical protein RIQ81_2018 [Pseudomonadota bacterium]|jgi:hypothetical protein